MKFQLLDASPTYDNDGWPSITLYGISEIGKPVIKYVHGFLHYFYMGGDPSIAEKFITETANKIGIQTKTQIVNRFLPLGYQSQPSAVLKIHVKNPKDVRLLQDFCANSNIPTYERI